MELSTNKSPSMMSASEVSIDQRRVESAGVKLRERRKRLDEAVRHAHDPANLESLLVEVDAALDRIASGTFGICEVCHESIDADYIGMDPLVRICLEHLSDKERKDMERDLELASSLQRSLLPRNQLRHEGWEITHHYAPAGLVSGDYCDVITSENARESFFLVGDVSGKGVSASFLMSQMHAIFRTLVGTLPELHDLFSRANRILTEAMSSAHFATLACAAANGTNRLRIINAGHCPPILVSQGVVKELESTGIPLGLFCGAEYGCNYVDLQSGDFLVMYTDGVTETHNAQDHQYGSDRLKSLAGELRDRPSQDLIDAVVRDVAAFRGNAPRQDDMTIMVIRKT